MDDAPRVDHLQRHVAAGIAEGDADDAARRVIVDLRGLARRDGVAGRRLQRPGRGPLRHRLRALRGQRVGVGRVALDRARGGEVSVGVGVDLLAGRDAPRLLAVDRHRAVEDLDQVRVVGAHQELELRAPDLGADGVAADVERGAAREVLDVD